MKSKQRYWITLAAAAGLIGSPFAVTAQQQDQQQTGQTQRSDTEYEWEADEGLHAEEWYDPSDWDINPDTQVDFESDWYEQQYIDVNEDFPYVRVGPWASERDWVDVGDEFPYVRVGPWADDPAREQARQQGFFDSPEARRQMHRQMTPQQRQQMQQQMTPQQRQQMQRQMTPQQRQQMQQRGQQMRGQQMQRQRAPFVPRNMTQGRYSVYRERGETPHYGQYGYYDRPERQMRRTTPRAPQSQYNYYTNDWNQGQDELSDWWYRNDRPAQQRQGQQTQQDRQNQQDD